MNFSAFHLSTPGIELCDWPSDPAYQWCARNALRGCTGEGISPSVRSPATAEADGPFFRITCFSCSQRKDRRGNENERGRTVGRAEEGRGRNRCVDRLQGESNVWTEGVQQCAHVPLTSWRSVWSSWPPVKVEIGPNVGGWQKIAPESDFSIECAIGFRYCTSARYPPASVPETSATKASLAKQVAILPRPEASRGR